MAFGKEKKPLGYGLWECWGDWIDLPDGPGQGVGVRLRQAVPQRGTHHGEAQRPHEAEGSLHAADP